MATEITKPKKGKSYKVLLWLLILSLVFSAVAVGFFIQINNRNKEITAKTQELLQQVDTLLLAGENSERNQVVYVERTPEEDFVPQTYLEAYKDLSSEFDRYKSDIFAFVGILSVTMAVFALAIPFMSYQFFQKEQLENFEESSQKQLDEHIKSFEQSVKAQIDTHLEKIKAESKCQMDALIKTKEDSLAELTKTVKAVTKSLLATEEETGRKEEPEVDTEKTALYYQLQGAQAYRDDDYEEAVRNYTKAIDLGLVDKKIHFNRAYAYAELKKYEEALADYSKAIELDIKYVYAYHNRGVVYRKLEEYEKALADYSKAIELNPKYAVAYNNRALTYYALEEYEEALKDYSKAIELDIKYAYAYNNRGFVYRKLEEYEKALADYNKAIELNPRYADTYNNRGVVYRKLEEYEKALEDWDKAIELDIKYAYAYYNRANLYLETGNLEKALEDINMADSLQPDDEETIALKAEIEAKIAEEAEE